MPVETESGPWTEYQAAEDTGPWADFQPESVPLVPPAFPRLSPLELEKYKAGAISPITGQRQTLGGAFQSSPLSLVPPVRAEEPVTAAVLAATQPFTGLPPELMAAAINEAKGFGEFGTSALGKLAIPAMVGSPIIRKGLSLLFGGQLAWGAKQKIAGAKTPQDVIEGLMEGAAAPVVAAGALPRRTVTQTTPVVPPSELPATPTETGLRPAVRKVGGEVEVGDAGQTHPEIIKENEIKAPEIDQRGFVNQQGQFLDREQAAAVTPEIPTTAEPQRRHSTDLPEAKAPEAEAAPKTESDYVREVYGIGKDEKFVAAAVLGKSGKVYTDRLHAQAFEKAKVANDAPEWDEELSIGYETDKGHFVPNVGADRIQLGLSHGKAWDAAKGTEVAPARDWDLFYENLTGELDAYNPARESGKINYDLEDMASRFVDYAKADKEGRTLDQLVSDFAEEDTASKSQISKLSQSVKRLIEGEKKAAPAPPDEPVVAKAGTGEEGAEVIDPNLKAQAAVNRKVTTEGVTSAKEAKATWIDELQKAISEAPSEDKFPGLKAEREKMDKPRYIPDEKLWTKAKQEIGTVTIDIPGDGISTILNTKEALQVVLDRAKQISTKSGEPAKVRKSGTSKEDKVWIQAQLAKGGEPMPSPPAAVEKGMSLQREGPGAQTAGQQPYLAASQLIDQLKAVPPSGTRETLTARERIADAWAKGKSLTDAATAKAMAVGQTIKETFLGRKPTDLDPAIGELDWLLQNSSARSNQMGQAMLKQQRNPTVRRAVALWIDTPGDATTKAKTLSDALQDLQQNPALWQRTTPEVRRALEMAARLPTDGVQFAESLRQYYGIRELDAIEHGIFGEMDSRGNIIRGGLDDYFTHVWKGAKNMPDDLRAAITNGRVSTYFQFARQRKLGMFLDGIMQGKTPELDPASVVPHYNYTLDRAIASRQFIKNATDNIVAADGRAALAPTGVVNKVGPAGAPTATIIKPKGKTEAIADYRAIDHPSMRKWKWAVNDENGNPVLSLNDLVVHPDYYERIARFMDRGRLTPTKWGRAALRASTEVKGFKLGLLSAFHQVHVSSHALFHWTLPFNFKDPRFFDTEGHINWDSPDVRFAVEKGHLKIAPDAHEISTASEGLMSGGLVHKLPIVGPWSRAYSEFTFGELIPKLKLKTFANAIERNRRWYQGKLTDDQIAARVGDSVNNAFGELNQLFLGKFGRDPRFQRILRGIFLAPDFGEARLRFVEKALTRFGGEERLALATMFMTLYTGARVANWLSHGDPEMDPKHAFDVKVGKHWWGMRSVLGDLDRAITDTGRFFYVRLNPLYSRTAADWLFGRDLNGRKLSPTQKFITRPLNQLVPIQAGSLTRDDQKMWESFVTAMGVSARADAPQQDVYEMVHKWMAGNPDPKIRAQAARREQEVFPPSDYLKLRFALAHDDQKSAQAAYNDLLKTRKPGTILQAMRPTHPFTGSVRNETRFKATLTPPQRKIYDQAMQDRRDVFARFQKLDRFPQTKTEVPPWIDFQPE